RLGLVRTERAGARARAARGGVRYGVRARRVEIRATPHPLPSQPSRRTAAARFPGDVRMPGVRARRASRAYPLCRRDHRQLSPDRVGCPARAVVFRSHRLSAPVTGAGAVLLSNPTLWDARTQNIVAFLTAGGKGRTELYYRAPVCGGGLDPPVVSVSPNPEYP